MNLKIRILIAIVIILTCSHNLLFAYDGVVHSKINEKAVREASQLDFMLKSNLDLSEGVNTLLSKKGKTNKIWQWIAYGGEAEDFNFGIFGLFPDATITYASTRAFNHFHDPLKAWDEAGFDDPFKSLYIAHYHRPPVSSILWGLNPGQQDFSANETGDWSWGKARELFYIYLTGHDFSGNLVASSKEEKEASFADCFRAVGQVMHLLEDMSVPLHTRNDGHILPQFGLGRWTYETYVSKNLKHLDYNPDQPGNYPSPDLLNDPQPDPIYADLAPITGLFDRNQYNPGGATPASDAAIGLAEYSNANFLTNDTLWKNPHPVLSETNLDASVWLNPEKADAADGVQDSRIYFGKSTGEPVDHLVAAGYWYYQLYMWNKPELKYAFIVDEKCYADYASKLIPRAVGYSATLLDYFFRGTMAIGNVTVQGDGFWINGLDFEVRNSTLLPDGSTVEPFENGSLSLAYRYMLSGVSEPQFGLAADIYAVDDLSDPINDDFVSISAAFPDDAPIPPEATNVTFTLVFRGRLGGEDNAVAAKVFHGSSWIAYAYQPGGQPNPSHIYTVSPDGSDRQKITGDAWDLGAFFSPDWGPHNMLLAFESEYDECQFGDPECYWNPRDIVVVDMNTGYITQRLRVDDDSHAHPIRTLIHPSFSPDGSRLAAAAIGFGSNGTNFYGLVVFDANTGSWHYINSYGYWDRDLTAAYTGPVDWSPLGDKIAYAIPDGAYSHGANIHTISPDGTGDVQLTYGDDNNHTPCWSPDGRRIVFVSDRDGQGSWDIWIMDQYGQNMSKILDCGSNCGNPGFSPDGSKIVFDSVTRIYTVNIDGTGLSQIETDAGNPSWSN
jgi:hypothetical protein